jgi:splicing factor 3B subunit 2
VLPERQVQSGGFFGSGHGYDLSSANKPAVLGAEGNDGRKRKKPGDIDVALDPDSLGAMSREDMARRYEEGQRQEGIGAKWAHEDDLTQMIAEESRKRQRTENERKEKQRESRYR